MERINTAQLYNKCRRIARAGYFDEDALHDAFADLIQSRAQADEQNVMRSYTLLLRRRASAATKTINAEEHFFDAVLTDGETANDDIQTDWGASPADYHKPTFRNVIRYARWTLTDDEMIVFELSMIEGLPIQAVAAALRKTNAKAIRLRESVIGKMVFRYVTFPNRKR